jgi:hypothetical protein
MLPFKGMLRGKRGLKWLEKAGSYAVVANRKLLRRGQASKYAVTNPRQRLVTSVHDSEDEAVMVAEALSNNEAGRPASRA